MKKLLFLSSVIMICLSGIAADAGESWVVVDKGKMDCKKLNIGITKARMVLKNGEKATVQIDDILAYALYGKVYSRLPLYKDGKSTGQMVFMELIKTAGNLSLYKYETVNSESISINDNIETYFVFDHNKMLLTVDEKTMPNISQIFGIRYSLQQVTL